MTTELIEGAPSGNALTPPTPAAPAVDNTVPAQVAPQAVTPAVEATPATQVVTEQPVTPPAQDAPAVAPAAAEVTPAAPAVEKAPDTFLGDKPAEAKVEPKAPEAEPVKTEEPKNEGGQTEEPAPPPTYEPFKLPDDTVLDNEKVGKFHEMLSKLELTGKASHDVVQAFGQEAVDFYISEVNQAVLNYHDKAVKTWEKQKNDWKEAVIKDPEMGGNRLNTTLDAARGFIRLYGGTQEQQDEIRNVMETSGLGNHPAIIRLFSSATRELAEGKPLAGVRPVPAPKSKTSTLYGKGNN